MLGLQENCKLLQEVETTMVSSSWIRVNTRSQQKYVFKVDTKIGKKYERSPYYNGTCLWNKMSKTVQDSENLFVFKKKKRHHYKVYNDKFV